MTNKVLVIQLVGVGNFFIFGDGRSLASSGSSVIRLVIQMLVRLIFYSVLNVGSSAQRGVRVLVVRPMDGSHINEKKWPLVVGRDRRLFMRPSYGSSAWTVGAAAAEEKEE